MLSDDRQLHDIQNKLRDIERALNESSIVAITDQRGDIQFVNDRFCKVSKYNRKELIGSNQSIVNSGYHSKEFMKDLWRTIGTGNVWKGEIKNRAKDGTYYWVDTTIVPFLNDKGKPYQYISIRHDITKRKRYEKIMEHMAYHDTLTSLPNRHYINKVLKEGKIKGKSHIALLYIDIDRFESVNDFFGHHIGDLILVEVANILKQSVRDLQIDGFISRYTGDKFVILIEDIPNHEDLKQIVEEIQENLTRPLIVDKKQIDISIKIGVCHTALQENEIVSEQYFDHLMEKASIALYFVKNSKEETYAFNTDEQNEKIEKFYTIDQDITYALERNQFFLVYQPLVSLKTQQIIGLEALLRWDHPTLGLIRPNEFIPLLEKREYIISVGEWIIETVCKQMKKWISEGVPLEMISVNVSPIQFSTKTFVSSIKKILERTGLDGKYLELEMTESTILHITDPARTLEELKALGIRVSIDDFGTGYSSLSRLNKLPIDTLKIDKSFIDHLDNNGEIIVDTIINMGKSLKYTVIAEGIETNDQVKYLTKQQCHIGQGYFFSKPVVPEKIAGLF